MAVAAIVLGALEFHTYRYYHRDNVCATDPSDFWPTRPPSTPSPGETDRISLCILYVSMLKVSGHGEGQLQTLRGDKNGWEKVPLPLVLVIVPKDAGLSQPETVPTAVDIT